MELIQKWKKQFVIMNIFQGRKSVVVDFVLFLCEFLETLPSLAHIYFREDYDKFISYIMAKFYKSLNRQLFALNRGCDV